MNSSLFVSLVENSPQGFFVFDFDSSGFIYTNNAFRSIFGREEEVLTLGDIAVNLGADELNYLKRKLTEYQKLVLEDDIEFKIDHPAGQEQWIRLTPIPFSEGTPKNLIAGSAVDITSEMVSLKVYKKYANKKNSILNILAHDLRGPLGVAEMANSILRTRIKDTELTGFIGTIEKVVKQAIHLISDLTQREFLESSEVVLNIKRMNVAAKLREVMEEYQKAEPEMNRTFTFRTNNENVFLDLDESKFIQVINNLMTNALKFTHDHSTISLTIDEKAESVRFCVEDNGVGIPEKDLPILFEKFTKARRKGLHGEPTLGLGMSVSKTIIEWHKGNIWIESKENEGTKVYFEIPKS